MKVFKRTQLINLVVQTISFMFTFLIYVTLHMGPNIGEKIYQSKYPKQYHTSLDSTYISLISVDYDLLKLNFHANYWAEKFAKAASIKNILIHDSNENMDSSFDNIQPDSNLLLQNKDSDFKLLLQRMTGISACIEDKKCKWHLSLTDDTVINIENFLKMLQSLGKDYHPDIDPVFISTCTGKTSGEILIDSNSTFLVSRRACDLILRSWEKIRAYFIKNKNTDLGRLAQVIGITTTEISSPYFIKYRIGKEDKNAIDSNTLNKCNMSIHHGTCGSVIGRIRDVAIVGNCQKRTKCQGELFTELPENVYFYIEDQKINLCTI